ncbi:alcohol dehydrogenase catalytic domain-containing protein, partial [Streptomyces sp. NPDC000188]|uniref:alcohol dehydrogenase catalytic domain-containing protein n=1 Tax=Streptomyces sp. NPDC000188 TaxID=3154245 RepID=UPI00331BAF5C
MAKSVESAQSVEPVESMHRAAVLHGPKDVRVEDRPVPEPGPGQVLVAVRAVGLCGSDLHYYAHGENGPNVLRQPTVLGHEPAGAVVGPGPRAGD